jgi:hypothetical protein
MSSSVRRPGVLGRNLGAQGGAVLIDGSALFLNSRALYQGQLDYAALAALIIESYPDLGPPSPGRASNVWAMWTSHAPQNEGQTRFIDFVEKRLQWQVRGFPPSDSFLVDPVVVFGMASDTRAASSRLVRFDSSIAYAIGRLADQYRIVVVSDSFGLAEPLARVAQDHPHRKPVLAFFGQALDSRWQRRLRAEPEFSPEFLDLDERVERLYGIALPSNKPVQPTNEGMPSF